MDLFDQLFSWFMSLGDQYGVNPVIFAVIYIGAIPFFTLSIAWLVRNYRNRLSIVMPALSASFFFVSAYLYLIIAGENVPMWVYGIVIAMVLYGGWTTFNKVQKKIKHKMEPDDE